MRTRLGRIGVCCVGAAGLSMALADESLPLRNDPFSRPQLAAMASKNPAIAGLGTTTSPEAGPLVTWAPRLKAVLVAGDRSLVNLDGTIVRLGEEVDGYRLVQVQDREAIFKKEKQRIVLKMGSSAARQTTERSTP
jgi:hypothetical protein